MWWLGELLSKGFIWNALKLYFEQTSLWTIFDLLGNNFNFGKLFNGIFPWQFRPISISLGQLNKINWWVFIFRSNQLFFKRTIRLILIDDSLLLSDAGFDIVFGGIDITVDLILTGVALLVVHVSFLELKFLWTLYFQRLITLFLKLSVFDLSDFIHRVSFSTLLARLIACETIAYLVIVLDFVLLFVYSPFRLSKYLLIFPANFVILHQIIDFVLGLLFPEPINLVSFPCNLSISFTESGFLINHWFIGRVLDQQLLLLIFLLLVLKFYLDFVWLRLVLI